MEMMNGFSLEKSLKAEPSGRDMVHKAPSETAHIRYRTEK
jgi:hypothetical protein